MSHPLFTAIEGFDHWAAEVDRDPNFPKGSDWETWYPGWTEIYKQFEQLLAEVDIAHLTDKETGLLLSAIDHDNEGEHLADITAEHPAALLHLAKAALHSQHNEAKWQLAIRLHLLPDRAQAIELLDGFVNDADEYVNRRALLAMSELDGEKTAYYCEKFWHREIYGAANEYQRMVVLTCLQTIGSPKLKEYLALARNDGREYLVQRVNEIEGKE